MKSDSIEVCQTGARSDPQQPIVRLLDRIDDVVG